MKTKLASLISTALVAVLFLVVGATKTFAADPIPVARNADGTVTLDFNAQITGARIDWVIVGGLQGGIINSSSSTLNGPQSAHITINATPTSNSLVASIVLLVDGANYGVPTLQFAVTVLQLWDGRYAIYNLPYYVVPGITNGVKVVNQSFTLQN